jgi:2-dehydropantoate 2-reductase
MVRADADVTFIDPWPEHVEQMRAAGLRITHSAAAVEPFTVRVRALHLTEVQSLAKEAPIDIAFVCMKSYDTAWATMLIAQYLAPGGYVVSLQNCMNEETVAGVVGWGKVLGCIASQIGVGLEAPGHVHRGIGKGGSTYTVFRVGEVHGRVTARAEEVRALVAHADAAKVTPNLWGERWSKLVANAMQNGISACTGLNGSEVVRQDALRRFTIRLGSEAVRVGHALGYTLEDILKLKPDTLARAGEGDAAALKSVEEIRLAAVEGSGSVQRPSMGQDMLKGRRTEIEFLNGFIVRKGAEVGIATPANAALTDIVTRVERGELQPDPRHIIDLRLN